MRVSPVNMLISSDVDLRVRRKMDNETPDKVAQVLTTGVDAVNLLSLSLSLSLYIYIYIYIFFFV